MILIQIIFKFSQHELPVNESILKEYVNGRKYQRLLDSTSEKIDVKDYMNFLQPCKEPFRKSVFKL